jgi:hypothetical protein
MIELNRLILIECDAFFGIFVTQRHSTFLVCS